MFLPFNKINSLRELGGSSYVDRKWISIFSGTKGREHGLMCPTSTLDNAKKLGKRFFSVCVWVWVRKGEFEAEF